jgi:uncharacterized DUF497 family protein
VAFEWDEAKSRQSAVQRRLPFQIAKTLFASPTVEWQDDRQDYGEQRLIAVGRVGKRFLVCVYTWRSSPDPTRRVISLRPAKRREIDVYRQAYPEAD